MPSFQQFAAGSLFLLASVRGGAAASPAVVPPAKEVMSATDLVASIRAELAAEYDARLDDLASAYDAKIAEQQQLVQELTAAAAKATAAATAAAAAAAAGSPSQGDSDTGTSSHSQEARRRLATSAQAGYSGLHIKSKNAGVSFGPDGDVQLLRSGPQELSVLGQVNVNGSINVSSSLYVAGQNILDAIDDAANCPVQEVACDAAAVSWATVTKCCFSGGWQPVFQLPIEDSADYDTVADIPYSLDNSELFPVGSFRRIAYHLQLDDDFIFVALDAFTENATRTGLPIDWTVDYGNITGLAVATNSDSVRDYNGMIGGIGSIEFWSHCYGRGSSGLYDHESSMNVARPDCYGSFQIHTVDQTTLFAYNAWSSSSRPGDLGIGPNPGEHPDWTFAENAANYTVKTLTVLVSDTAGERPKLAEYLATKLSQTEAKLEGLLSCSYENDINARCGDPDDEFKMKHCCDGGGWVKVLQLEIEDSADYDVASEVPYTFDNTSSYADSSFSRVAYHLQLDDEWVFTSMNAFVKNSANLGLPVDAVKDYDDIGRLNVISNAPSLQNISGTTHMQGMIEFWSNCYGTGGGSGYDANDDISATTDCYGSFQVHTENGDTVFAYNGWSSAGNNDLGIGNRPTGHADWTHAKMDLSVYTVKTLTVFVLPN